MGADEELDEEDLREILEEFDLTKYKTTELYKDIDTDIRLLKNLLPR